MTSKKIFLTFFLNKKGLSKSQLIEFDYIKALKAQFERQTALLENYYTGTKKSQLEFINAHLEFFVETSLKVMASTSQSGPTTPPTWAQFLDKFYVKTLHFLFNDFEFLSQEAVLEWYDKQCRQMATLDESDPKNGVKKYAIGKLKPLIEWIKKEDDDNDDEEEEEDDDDDDEE